MESRTLAQLRASVRFASDTEGLTSRHPDANLTRVINQAIRALRALVTARGGAYFLTNTTAATLASTAVTGEDYSEVPFPASAVEIHGVDVLLDETGHWRSLTPIGWVQRRDLSCYDGPPEHFAILSIPTGSASATVAGKIAIVPKAETGSYKVWYLPDFTDLSSDTDVFLGLPEWHEWVEQHVVELLSQRDDDQRQTYAIANTRKREAEVRIEESIGRVRSAGALRPRRSERRLRDRWYPWRR